MIALCSRAFSGQDQASDSRVSRQKEATVVLSQTELQRAKRRDGETEQPSVTDMNEGKREN